MPRIVRKDDSEKTGTRMVYCSVISSFRKRASHARTHTFPGHAHNLTEQLDPLRVRCRRRCFVIRVIRSGMDQHRTQAIHHTKSRVASTAKCHLLVIIAKNK
jgi:hypothetical protein